MSKLQLQIKAVVRNYGCISYGNLIKELNYTENVREHVELVRELCHLVDSKQLLQSGGIYGDITDPTITIH